MLAVFAADREHKPGTVQKLSNNPHVERSSSGAEE
jgi:hypothetical protein